MKGELIKIGNQFNVWIGIEDIDGENEANGTDVMCHKFHEFDTYAEAEQYFNNILGLISAIAKFKGDV
jgi:hypothetical protein